MGDRLDQRAERNEVTVTQDKIIAMLNRIAVGVLVALTLLIAIIATTYPRAISLEGDLMRWIATNYQGLSNEVKIRLLGLIIAGIITTNSRAIIGLLRRTLQRTDEQITKQWYIHRWSMKHGRLEWVVNVWNIRRSLLTRKYLVSQYDGSTDTEIRGEIVYKERDRLNMQITGINHRQQSLIAFQTTIPAHGDKRMLGIGVGDSADYLLTCRIYLASRAAIQDDVAKELVKVATNKLRGTTDDLLQLSIVDIAEIFKAPPEEEPAKQSSRLFDLFSTFRTCFYWRWSP